MTWLVEVDERFLVVGLINRFITATLLFQDALRIGIQPRCFIGGFVPGSLVAGIGLTVNLCYRLYFVLIAHSTDKNSFIYYF